MKINFLIFLSILSIIISCHGQTKHIVTNPEVFKEPTTKGKTVQGLSDHLWYVFHDTKKNYWFGSNGEGIYRYGCMNTI
jgi:hypothetical protein